MLPTKNAERSRNEIVETVERFISEREAGFNPDADGLTVLEYEGVLAWDFYERQYKRMFERVLVRVAGMAGAFGGREE